MSQETLTSLAKALQTNAALRDKFLSETTVEGRVKVATENGFQITNKDLESLFGTEEDKAQSEMSETELSSVAGGVIARDVGGIHTLIVCTIQTLQIGCGLGMARR